MTSNLDKKQYVRGAAILTQVFLDENNDIALHSLPDSTRRELLAAIEDISLVEKDELKTVVDAYLAALDRVGFTARIDDEKSTRFFERTPPNHMQRKASNDAEALDHDLVDSLVHMPMQVQIALINREADEVAAILLSALPTQAAAQILNALDGIHARQITFALSQLGARSRENKRQNTVLRHAQNHDGPVEIAETQESSVNKNIGALLSTVTSEQRQSIIDGLTEIDSEFGRKIRQEIFTFELIPARVSSKDIPLVTRRIGSENLLKALKHCQATTSTSAEVTDYFTNNLPKRLAEQLFEDLSAQDAIPVEDGEKAQAEAINVIQSLVDSGEIALAAATDP